MTYIGEPEKEIESTPMVEPVPEIIEMPEVAPEHAPGQPVPTPVPVESGVSHAYGSTRNRVPHGW